jgi:hypothetical protein
MKPFLLWPGGLDAENKGFALSIKSFLRYGLGAAAGSFKPLNFE